MNNPIEIGNWYENKDRTRAICLWWVEADDNGHLINDIKYLDITNNETPDIGDLGSMPAEEFVENIHNSDEWTLATNVMKKR